jgi:hypothetical protein
VAYCFSISNKLKIDYYVEKTQRHRQKKTVTEKYIYIDEYVGKIINAKIVLFYVPLNVKKKDVFLAVSSVSFCTF